MPVRWSFARSCEPAQAQARVFGARLTLVAWARAPSVPQGVRWIAADVDRQGLRQIRWSETYDEAL
jgi:hypothetical protein